MLAERNNFDYVMVAITSEMFVHECISHQCARAKPLAAVPKRWKNATGCSQSPRNGSFSIEDMEFQCGSWIFLQLISNFHPASFSLHFVALVSVEFSIFTLRYSLCIIFDPNESTDYTHFNAISNRLYGYAPLIYFAGLFDGPHTSYKFAFPFSIIFSFLEQHITSYLRSFKIVVFRLLNGMIFLSNEFRKLVSLNIISWMKAHTNTKIEFKEMQTDGLHHLWHIKNCPKPELMLMTNDTLPYWYILPNRMRPMKIQHITNFVVN